MEKEKIRAFAQDTLGCGCPEGVFQHIECNTNVNREGHDILYDINIGNRLLIYVVSLDRPDSMKEMLPALIAAGKRARDGSGFNRFRLVVATDDDKTVKKVAEEMFRNMQTDEKIHLHVLPKDRIPQF